jgi:hypothetical protein
MAGQISPLLCPAALALPLFGANAPAAADFPLVSRQIAIQNGFTVLAGPYTRPLRWMARKVLQDLARDSAVGVLVVKQSRGLEIWIKRHNSTVPAKVITPGKQPNTTTKKNESACF